MSLLIFGGKPETSRLWRIAPETTAAQCAHASNVRMASSMVVVVAVQEAQKLRFAKLDFKVREYKLKENVHVISLERMTKNLVRFIVCKCQIYHLKTYHRS
eukprot:GHVU01076808.1.p1 GENE.GHVU01076808.1~~GHVU01076808.1.p1  ORF type:complete len:101 (-),score=1.38 GHVU01076808.1:186-488(-)